ncbi:MAG TPA: hypothetical protein VER33_14190 [Polyangiaceae bacterium]|nr:hypothetical protein [Polyangiaceae bacterium]
MTKRISHRRSAFVLVCSTAALFAQVVGCSSDEGGLLDPMAGNAGLDGGGRNQGGSSVGGNSMGGQQNLAGSGGKQTMSGGAGAIAGAAGADPSGDAGATSGGSTGDGGVGGPGGSDAVGGEAPVGGSGGAVGAPPTLQRCVYHTEAPDELTGGAGASAVDPELAEGGAGGESANPTIKVATNRLFGKFLTDSKGMSLYTFGLDLPGDCNSLPISNCYDTAVPASKCETEWPIFREYPRDLPPELDIANFGMVQRTDGSWQTTYFGWPLYYYYVDKVPGDITGQAVGVWYLAEAVLPNIVVMRVGNGATRKVYLADQLGKTLYKYDGDTVGTTATRPVSACTGTCLGDFEPFFLESIDPTTNLEPTDFRTFQRGDGQLQLAYKGAPLYRAITDQRSGDMTGSTLPGGLLAER